MTSFQLPATLFPENAITRAERAYQQRSAKRPRAWRRSLTRTVMLLLITLSLIEFVGLLVASLTQRDPTPLVQSLAPLPTLLVILTSAYHLALTFQTISLSANSITREKESQTWEVLVLTGIDARQIVRGKWWAIVQRQLRSYAVLALLRAGMTVAIGIAVSTVFSRYYSYQFMLAHPLTILSCALIGAGYTFANLGLSAACGVMASASSKRGSFAILRGFAIQIVFTVLCSAISLWLINLVLNILRIRGSSTTYTAFTGIAFSFLDNGIMTGISSIGPFLSYDQSGFSFIKPVDVIGIAAALIGIALYSLLVLFVLRRAEKSATHALATPFENH